MPKLTAPVLAIALLAGHAAAQTPSGDLLLHDDLRPLAFLIGE